MNDELLQFIKECISKNDMHSFYIKKEWQDKRLEIIKRDHCECQSCRRKGIIKVVKPNSKLRKERAYVHHIKHLKDYPELALDNANLETLCFECHELEHINERHYFEQVKERYVNEEKW